MPELSDLERLGFDSKAVEALERTGQMLIAFGAFESWSQYVQAIQAMLAEPIAPAQEIEAALHKAVQDLLDA